MEADKIEVAVKNKIYYLDPFTGKCLKEGYKVACKQEGCDSIIREVQNLKKIRWFEIFGVPDAELTLQEKNGLVKRLQETSLEAPVVKKVQIGKSGLFQMEETMFYLVGNHLYSSRNNNEVESLQMDISENMEKSYSWRKTIEEEQRVINPNSNPLVISTSEMVDRFVNVAPRCSEIIFFATLYAAIKPILNEAGMTPYSNFILNIYGQSGSFKSSVTRAITTVSDSKELQGSYVTDKKTELLRRQRNATGFVFLLDDYHAQASDYAKKRQMDILNSIVRQAESDPNAGVVVTSSEYLDGIISTQDRCVQIEIQSVNRELLTRIQNSENFMPSVVDLFVRELMRNYAEVIKEIPVIFRDMKNVSEGLRLDSYAKMLLLVAKLYVKYVCNDELGKEQENKLREALEFQTEIQTRHMRQMRLLEIDGGDIGIVLKMLDSGIFVQCTEGNYHHLQNEIMVVGKQGICITPQAFKYGLKKYLNGATVKSSDVIRHLDEEGILCCDNSGDSTKKVGVTKKRALCLSIPALLNYCLINFENDKELKECVSRFS